MANNLKGELIEDGYCINCKEESSSDVCIECQYNEGNDYDEEE